MSCIKILQEDIMYKNITTGCHVQRYYNMMSCIKILQQDVMYKDITTGYHV